MCNPNLDSRCVHIKHPVGCSPTACVVPEALHQHRLHVRLSRSVCSGVCIHPAHFLQSQAYNAHVGTYPTDLSRAASSSISDIKDSQGNTRNNLCHGCSKQSQQTAPAKVGSSLRLPLLASSGAVSINVVAFNRIDMWSQSQL